MFIDCIKIFLLYNFFFTAFLNTRRIIYAIPSHALLFNACNVMRYDSRRVGQNSQVFEVFSSLVLFLCSIGDLKLGKLSVLALCGLVIYGIGIKRSLWAGEAIGTCKHL